MASRRGVWFVSTRDRPVGGTRAGTLRGLLGIAARRGAGGPEAASVKVGGPVGDGALPTV
jgi:hypothetical protein